MNAALFLLIGFLAMVGLAACGKVGAPQPPGPPDQVTYPRSYPAY